MRSRLILTVTACLSLLGLAACGQKGDLYLPPEDAGTELTANTEYQTNAHDVIE